MENSSDEDSTLKRAEILVRGNAPVELRVSEETHFFATVEDRLMRRRISSTLSTYRNCLKKLLAGRYSSLKEAVPVHLTDACRMMAFVFTDGILVRYDLKGAPDQRGFVGLPESGSLELFAPKLSGSLVHCPSKLEGFDPGEQFVTITLSKCPVGTRDFTDFAKLRFFVVAQRGKSNDESRLPVPLVSVLNEFTFQLVGEQSPEQGGSALPFVIESRMRLQLGWEAIEIYPPFRPDVWDPGLASVWAERDLLAAIARRNLSAEYWRNIDPNAQARRQKVKLLADLAALLNGPEEPLHQFIREAPQLICPTYARVWSKLQLGARVTDFVLRESTGDYLLVELESPLRALFRKDGQPSAELTHAVDQTIDWKRYLEDNLSYAQRELGLEGISASPRRLIVMGRSASLNPENRRKLLTMENDQPRLKIITYDDLLESAQAAFENLLGPLWDPGPNAEVYFLPPKK